MLKLVNEPQIGQFFYCNKDKYVIIEGDDTHCLYSIGDSGMCHISTQYSTIAEILKQTFSDESLQKLTYNGKPVFENEVEIIKGAVYTDRYYNYWVLIYNQDRYSCLLNNGYIQYGYENLTVEQLRNRMKHGCWVMVAKNFSEIDNQRKW